MLLAVDDVSVIYKLKAGVKTHEQLRKEHAFSVVKLHVNGHNDLIVPDFNPTVNVVQVFSELVSVSGKTVLTPMNI